MNTFPFTASGQSHAEILDEEIEELSEMMEGDWWFEDDEAVEVVND